MVIVAGRSTKSLDVPERRRNMSHPAIAQILALALVVGLIAIYLALWKWWASLLGAIAIVPIMGMPELLGADRLALWNEKGLAYILSNAAACVVVLLCVAIGAVRGRKRRDV